MKHPILAIVGLCAMCAAAAPAQQVTASSLAAAAPLATDVPLRFVNTDASDVLLAIARAYRANIIIPADLKKPVTLNLVARSLEDALSAVAGAAGLSWRRIGNTYVVATPVDLKQALEARGERVRVPLKALSATEAVSLLTEALPFLTARAAGTDVLLIGAPVDIEQGRAILAEQERTRLAEPTSTAVVPLQYAAGSQVISVLKDIYPTLKATLVGAADKPGGVLSLTGPASQVTGAEDIIRRLDIQTTPSEPQRFYRVYQIRYSSAPTLQEFIQKAAPSITALLGPETFSPPRPSFQPISGATLGSSTGGGVTGFSGGTGGAGGSAGGTSGFTGMSGTTGADTFAQQRKPGDRAKTLVLSGTAADLDAAVKLLEDVDLPPKQVLVEVKVIDTSPEYAEQLGVTWNWTRFGFYEAPNGTSVDTANTTPGGDFTKFNTRPLGFGQLSRVPWSFQAVVNALITRRQAKLLANPRMQVTDNDDANIFIGDTLRTQISQSGIAGTTIQIFEFPIGIILLVRPRINADGNITMRIHPVVSTVTSLGPGDIPQTASREAETTVMLKDGETVVVGGLIRDELSKTVLEIPILSKLPIVGELFKSRSTDHRHSEILVIITPHIIQ